MDFLKKMKVIDDQKMKFIAQKSLNRGRDEVYDKNDPQKNVEK